MVKLITIFFYKNLIILMRLFNYSKAFSSFFLPLKNDKINFNKKKKILIRIFFKQSRLCDWLRNRKSEKNKVLKHIAKNK